MNFTQFFKRFKRNDSGRRHQRSGVRQARWGRLEPLETRRLFGVFALDINWENRGDDNFGVMFNDPAAARVVVDWAINAWEAVITDFNYDDVLDGNTFDLEVYADASDINCGAHTETGGTVDGGVPKDGDIYIHNCLFGGDTGWFLDPTPWESSEFMGTLINPFAGTGQAGSAANGIIDLFSGMVHELGHALGISGDEDFIFEDFNDNTPPFVDTGQNDTAAPGTLWTYDFGTGGVKALFTDNNGGGGSDTDEPLHSAARSSANQVGGTYFSGRDFMNPGIPNGWRFFPSQMITRVLAEVYGYSITNRWPNFHAQLDNNGNLVVRGGTAGEMAGGVALNTHIATAPSNDTITLERDGDFLLVTVDLGLVEPGTDITAPLTSRFLFSDITTISILPDDNSTASTLAGDGNDLIDLDFTNGSVVPPGGLTVNAGTGNDILRIEGPTSNSTYAIATNTITINGDVINYAAAEQLAIHPPLIDISNTIAITGLGPAVNSLFLVASNGSDNITWSAAPTQPVVANIGGAGGNDLFDIQQVNNNVTLNLFGDAGGDIFNFGSPSNKLNTIAGTINVFGNSGNDFLQFDDAASLVSHVYTFDVDAAFDGSFTSDSGLTVLHNDIESTSLQGGTRSATVRVIATPSGSDVFVDAGLQDDFILVNDQTSLVAGTVNEIRSKVTIDGNRGYDFVFLNDRGDDFSNTVTVADGSVGHGSSDNFFGNGGEFAYSKIEELLINMGRPDDNINVTSSSPGTLTTINGNEGFDAFVVTSPDEKEPDFGHVGGVRSHVVLNGDGGGNSLWINDTTDDTIDQVTITDAQVGNGPGDNFFGPGGYVSYNDMNSMQINGGTPADGSGGNTFLVRNVHPNTPTLIQMGHGDDLVHINDGSRRANGIVSHLTVEGQNGNDELLINHGSELFSTIATVRPTQIGAGGLVSYFETNVTINTGFDIDLLLVEGTSTGSDIQLNTGAGNDATFVDSNGVVSGGKVDTIRSRVSMDGEAGADAMLLYNISDNTTDKVTIDNGVVGGDPTDQFFGPGGSAAYTDIDRLRLFTSSSHDRIEIMAAGPDTILDVEAGDGDDLLTVHAPMSAEVNYNGDLPTTGPGDALALVGNGMTGSYTPSATLSGDGTVELDGGGVIDFTELEPVSASGFATFTFVTPNSNDSLQINPFGGFAHEISGTSGGVAFETLLFDNITTMVIDTGKNDVLAAPHDQLFINAADMPATGVDVLRYRSGFGSDLAEAGSGRVNLDFDADDQGILEANGPTTVVRLVETQFLSQVFVNNGALVELAAGGNNVLVVEELHINGGNNPQGTLDIHDNAAVINYLDTNPSPFGTHENQIEHARTQNLPVLWTGTGITSGQAAANPNNFDVGIFETGELLPGGGLFHGVTLAPGDDAVLIETVPVGATLPYFDDYEDGVADFMQPVSAGWSVSAGQYHASPLVGQNAITLLNLVDPLPSNLVIDVAMSSDPSAGGYFSNTLLIYNYTDPQNFSYAGVFAGAGQWRIGSMVGGVKNNHVMAPDGMPTGPWLAECT